MSEEHQMRVRLTLSAQDFNSQKERIFLTIIKFPVHETTMKKKSLHSCPTWKKILSLLFLGILILVGTFIYGIITDEPPKFFPLDDAQAEYTITKNCPSGQGWQEPRISDLNAAYCLEYRGDHVLWLDDFHQNTKFFSITIGKSPIDLEPFVGKRVKNVKGKFASSSKQCIQKQCVAIGGPFVVLNIDNLELVQDSTIKAVGAFSKDKVQGLTFIRNYYSGFFGGNVDESEDAYGAQYQIDTKTNKIIYFNAYGIDNFPKERTTVITPQQAEKIGFVFAKENIIDFENYTKNAEYSFLEETSPKMLTKYNLNWITKKEDQEGKLRPYHSIIVLDKYGNVIIFQNEFTDQG